MILPFSFFCSISVKAANIIFSDNISWAQNAIFIPKWYCLSYLSLSSICCPFLYLLPQIAYGNFRSYFRLPTKLNTMTTNIYGCVHDFHSILVLRTTLSKLSNIKLQNIAFELTINSDISFASAIIILCVSTSICRRPSRSFASTEVVLHHTAETKKRRTQCSFL